MRGQFNLSRTQAIFMAGREMRIPVTILGEEGDPVTLQSGIKTKVSEGYTYLEVENQGASLSKFWKRVDKIKTK